MASKRCCLPEFNKTVFVVEHSAASLEYSDDAYELDPSSDANKQKLRKSLWTSCTEATLEYSRIVFDLFEADKQRIAVVAASASGTTRTVSSFDVANQSWTSLAARFGECGAPSKLTAKQVNGEASKGSDTSVFESGLRKALELLVTPTQWERRARFLRRHIGAGEEEATTRGRVILLCTGDVPGDMDNRVEKLLAETNASGTRGEDRWAISRLDVVCVRVQARPGTDNEPRRPTDNDAAISLSSYTWRADATLATQFVRLAATHLQLLSTTISGIPMREDATSANSGGAQGASTNYNIEIVHSRALYADFERVGLLAALRSGASGTCANDAQTVLAPSVILRWNAPRQNAAAQGDQLPLCTAASAFTPLDVAHRAAQCLTSGYLLQRRAAVLELPKRAVASLAEAPACTDTSDGRPPFSLDEPAVQTALATQFLIVAHAGRCYIHALVQPRTTSQPNSDTSSTTPALCITETAGGRVMDYRISDFAEVLKQSSIAEADCERGSTYLERATRCWPSRLTLSDTIVHNLNASFVDALLGTLTRANAPALSDADVEQCTTVLRRLQDHDTQRLPLPLRAPLARLKGVRRDEQYTAMWTELEQFVGAFSDASPPHADVLAQVFAVRGLRVPDRVTSLRARVERAAARRARRGAHSNKEKEEKEKEKEKPKDKTAAKVDPPETTTRNSGEPVTIPLESEREQNAMSAAKRARFTAQTDSIFAIVQRAVSTRSAVPRRDFDGRLKQLQSGAQIAELYTSLTPTPPAASGKA